MLGPARNLAVYAVLSVWLGGIARVRGQGTVGSDGCLRLLGSVACPGFQYAYVHPQNLSNAWPWLQGVTTVSQFDVAALNYFVNPDQFQQTKFVDQLGCTNATGAVLRWERSVLCSQWVNSQWGRACTALYNGTSAATSQKMICQSTCLEYNASERQIVNSSTYCPGPAPTDGSRESRLLKDYVDCTEWTTLATNDTATCIQGSQNEGNCGYGTSTSQLCDYCRGNQPDECCYDANVGQSVCGYELAARPSLSSSSSPSSTSASASASGSAQADQANSSTGNGTSLTNGQLAGTIVGSVLGGLLLLALLLLLLLCVRRRRRSRSPSGGIGPETARPTSGGAFSSMFGGSNSASASGPTPVAGATHGSEKALLGGLGAGGPAGMSSPTMQGSIAGGGKGMLSSGSLGVPAAAAAGAGVGAGAGVAAAATGGRGGNVLPRVKDENQDGERFIEQGGEVTVLWPYTATLPDELDLRPGMRLRVVRLYDDAWGTGQVISSPESSGGEVGRQGAFPIVCVSEGSSFGSSRSESSG